VKGSEVDDPLNKQEPRAQTELPGAADTAKADNYIPKDVGKWLNIPKPSAGNVAKTNPEVRGAAAVPDEGNTSSQEPVSRED
jgi:hypothetical protein